MAWSLWELKKEKAYELEPKRFSNSKNQEDIVKEVIGKIRSGKKIIFVHGVCGSGKSAIALNIAKELGRASIVVPIKNLQRQYENDYMRNKFLLKEKGDKLRIAMLTGRRNHKCIYLNENKEEILKTKPKEEEKNSTLFDIFQNKSKEIGYNNKKEDESCDNFLLPCKIEIKQRNINTLKKYYRENAERKNNKELDLKLLRRLAVAPACPYWSPILREDSKIKLSGKQKKYKSITGEQIIFSRKEGCPYYEQFKAYGESDAIIFNSDHYLLETALGRKPLTDVEIIDECDEFLDSFAVEGSINLDKLKNELIMFESDDEGEKKIIKQVLEELELVRLGGIRNFQNEEILHINETEASELIKSFVSNDIFYENRDDESYFEHCFEVAKDFYNILEDVYISFSKDKRGDIYLKLVTVRLEKMLNNIIEKNKAFVFMSGTIHSQRVLNEIFGIKDFEIVEAEVMRQGSITKVKTGLEKDFSFDNFKTGKVTREDYLRALDKSVEMAKKPTLIHVTAFQDLPSIEEIERYNLKNLMPNNELIEEQNLDKEGRIVREFKEGKREVLFTTRCNRGIDFPFSTCNSVVITRFPYPNTQSLFWRILKKNKPIFFWDFYKDKAHRDLLQKIYRSVRAVDDHVFLLSPDLRVLDSKIV